MICAAIRDELGRHRHAVLITDDHPLGLVAIAGGCPVLVAVEGERCHRSRWRRIPMASSSSLPARCPHSASSSMLLAPETTAQAHTSRIAVREYHRPRRDRGWGTESR
jgi:hypothetical protein